MTPPFPLQNRIAAALTTACPRHSHCDLMGPAAWAVVQPDIQELLASNDELATELADARTELQKQDTEIQRLGAHLAARDHALRLVGEHAETVKGERNQLKKLLEEALHLHMHGERAPGGNENWRDWETKTERVLRAMLDEQTALWEG